MLFQTDELGKPIIDEMSEKCLKVSCEVMEIMAIHNLTAAEAIRVIDFVNSKISKQMHSVRLAIDI